ncbi:MAG: hypothetical protein ABSD72_06255 [Terracidiphilus sp.]|jgi:hypothetical protein
MGFGKNGEEANLRLIIGRAQLNSELDRGASTYAVHANILLFIWQY